MPPGGVSEAPGNGDHPLRIVCRRRWQRTCPRDTPPSARGRSTALLIGGAPALCTGITGLAPWSRSRSTQRIPRHPPVAARAKTGPGGTRRPSGSRRGGRMQAPPRRHQASPSRRTP